MLELKAFMMIGIEITKQKKQKQLNYTKSLFEHNGQKRTSLHVFHRQLKPKEHNEVTIWINELYCTSVLAHLYQEY